MNQPKDIYEYVKQEEAAMVRPIQLVEQGNWNFKEHVRLTSLFKNSMFSDGSGSITNLKDIDRPFRNIILPILNLQYRAEGFDVKDIDLYVDDPDKYFMSMLVRKYHERWALENEIDTFIDDMVESYVDYGGALIKDINDIKPEVVPLQSIAFCDQTGFLSGPIGIKHNFSPEELLAMADAGWGDEANGATATLDEVITLAGYEKEASVNQSNRTPTKNIEIYEVQGVLPRHFLEGGMPTDFEAKEKYTRQTQIICYYKTKDGKEDGITLFKKAREDNPFKQIIRHPIYGRCLGRGGVEELFQSQIWTNYSEIRKMDMLDAASKVIIKTTDTDFGRRNNLKDMDNLEIVTLQEGTDAGQLDTVPRSIALFDKATMDWFQTAQLIASANDSILGQQPQAGTPFALQNLVTQESHSIHDYRKGKLATFLGTVYHEWIIPSLAREITKGTTFLAELDVDELKQVTDAVVENEAAQRTKDAIMAGKMVTPDQLDALKQLIRDDFAKAGSKRFMVITKGEFKDAPLSVKVNIAGKQKYLSQQVNSLTNVFRQIIMAPQVLNDPRMAKLFNQILEASGLEPMDFSGAPIQGAQPPQQPQQPTPSPIQPAPQPA